MLSRKTLALWTVTMSLGWGTGAALSLLDARDVATGTGNIFMFCFSIIIGTSAGAVGAAIALLGQRLLLADSLEFVRTDGWTNATLVGMSLGWGLAHATLVLIAPYLGLHEYRTEAWLLAGALSALIVGVALGIAQAVVVRGFTRKAVRWALLCAAAWCLGGIAHWTVYIATGGPLAYRWTYGVPEPWPGDAVFLGSLVAGWLAGGLVTGVITGSALSLLSAQRRAPSPPSGVR